MTNLDKRLFNLLKKVYTEQAKGLQISNAVKIALGRVYRNKSNPDWTYSDDLCARINEVFPDLGIKPKTEAINFVFDEIKRKGFAGAGFDFSPTSRTGLSEDTKSKYFWVSTKTKPARIGSPTPFNVYDILLRRINQIFEDTPEIKNSEKAFKVAATLFAYDEFYPVFKNLVYKPWLVKDKDQKQKDRDAKQSDIEQSFRRTNPFIDRKTIRDEIATDQRF